MVGMLKPENKEDESNGKKGGSNGNGNGHGGNGNGHGGNSTVEMVEETAAENRVDKVNN